MSPWHMQYSKMLSFMTTTTACLKITQIRCKLKLHTFLLATDKQNDWQNWHKHVIIYAENLRIFTKSMLQTWLTELGTELGTLKQKSTQLTAVIIINSQVHSIHVAANQTDARHKSHVADMSATEWCSCMYYAQ